MASLSHGGHGSPHFLEQISIWDEIQFSFHLWPSRLCLDSLQLPTASCPMSIPGSKNLLILRMHCCRRHFITYRNSCQISDRIQIQIRLRNRLAVRCKWVTTFLYNRQLPICQQKVELQKSIFLLDIVLLDKEWSHRAPAHPLKTGLCCAQFPERKK